MMTKIRYEYEEFSTRGLKWINGKPDSMEAIEMANTIIDEYDMQGYTLTLRQLYYQFVGRGLLIENTQRAYKNLGNLITKGRNNGLISWNAIEDGGRSVNGISNHEENDHEVVSGLEYMLSLDFWQRQDTYVEVWVEKEALKNVVSRACRPLKCAFMPTKGYLSASEAWRAGQRFQAARDAGKEVIMFHLGDHDPEGIDMTRDNQARLELYSQGSVQVERLGLNMDQVREYNPPPNYAKPDSSRYQGYVDEYGEECWELDALEPKVIVDLITEAVEPCIDRDVWNQTLDEQYEKRHHLAKLSEHWDSIKDHIDEIDPRDPDDWNEDDDHDDYG